MHAHQTFSHVYIQNLIARNITIVTRILGKENIP
jgi:hypothetical protein